MNTKILDHIDFEKVNTLLEGFNQTTGFVTAILDLEGNVLSKSGWRQICTEFHRINPETAKRCAISDTVLANKMIEGEKYHFYKCLNGLVDVAVPIIIKGEHAANLFSGQFFFEEPDVSFFKKQAEIHDFEESSYLKALEKVPIISQEKAKTAMNFLLNMTEMISEITFQKLEQIELNEERMKAENEINKQKSLFETMFNTIPDGVVITDTERVIKLANKGMKSTFGYEPEELLGKSTKILYADQDKYEKTGEIVFTGKAKKLEDLYVTRYKDMSGREFFGETFGAKLFDGKNQWIGNLGIMRDITEREQAGEALRESEKKYRMIAENMADIITTMDMNLRFTYVSPSIIRLRGFTVEEALEQTIDQIMTAYSFQLIAKAFEEELRLEATATADLDRTRILELEEYRKDGSTIWVENTLSFIRDKGQKPIGIIVVSRDISERRQSEEALQQSEEDLKESQRIAHVGSWRLDVLSNQVVWSDELYKMYGFDPSLPPPPYNEQHKIFTPESWERLSKALPETIKTGTSYELELEMLRKDGSNGWMWVKGEVVRDVKGTVAGLRGAAQDITERKNAEDILKINERRYKSTQEALRKSEERLSLTLDSVTDAVWDWRVDTGEIYFSSRWYTMLGYDPYEMPQEFETWQNLLHPDDLPDAEKIIFSHLNKTEPFEMEFRMRTKDNQWRWILARGKTVEIDNQGKAVRMLGIHMDITERKKMEERIQQTQKMESIGTLAGGIAHDFNNILFPIVGHTEMLIADIPEDSPFQPGLKQIYTGALRASELVKQILTFSRQESGELKLMKMQPIIKEALKLIRSTIPTTIEIKQNISPACGVIKADPTQIHQIVMNLCTNAYHAMEETGSELKVSLKEVELGALDLINSEMAIGVYACLAVADKGKGMDKNLTNQIFDPFFTTKEKGKGTGMGLSVVHGIVTSMNGAIQVYSEPGKGTVFNVYLPVEKSSFVKHSIQTHETIQYGTETILLVDDEDAIITMEKRMLERLGYQVTSRTSSIEALEVFRGSPDKFDLVITDMAMPNIPGDKLSTELVKLRADIPILLCTGFSETMSEEKAALLGIKGFLFKPIVMQDLSQKIREVLDGKKASKSN